MTTLDDGPMTGTDSYQDFWEWHEFTGGDGWAHLYLHSQMANPRLVMLLPWCLTDVRFPLEHDRPSISRRRVIPRPGRVCPVCAAQNERRRIEVPRARS
ncbi:hypothetical protein AB0L41_15915 [Amycolatopsis mediterranei]|uniref:hypothetical protein n=1 Tax=Amycolatopsis mediterranei TaxID=33910 RepID=UPI003428CA45